MKKNEPLLKATSYFWSSAFNAFLFRDDGPMTPADVHMLTGLKITIRDDGPMTPTLANVHMLTCLKITSSVRPFKLMNKPCFKFDSIRTGGWTNYINTHKSSKNSVDTREHTAFLNIFVLWIILWSNVQLFVSGREIGTRLQYPLRKVPSWIFCTI